jgi:hypothetical protein
MKRRTRPATFIGAERTVTASSPDDVLRFRVSACSHGIHVERAQRYGLTRRITVQSMRFVDDASFVRWCDTDQLKFSYPLLYDRLRRDGCALFRSS